MSNTLLIFIILFLTFILISLTAKFIVWYNNSIGRLPAEMFMILILSFICTTIIFIFFKTLTMFVYFKILMIVFFNTVIVYKVSEWIYDNKLPYPHEDNKIKFFFKMHDDKMLLPILSLAFAGISEYVLYLINVREH